MIYVYSIFSLLILFILYGSFEARFLEIKKIDFKKDKECLKLMQLSDIHYGRLKVHPEKIKSAIEYEHPDVIIITGDCIEKAEHSQGFLDFIDFIKGDYKICLCLGNHDYKAFSNNEKGLDTFIESLRKMGVEVLIDQCTQLEKNNKIYNLIGFQDVILGNPNLVSAFDCPSTDCFMNIGFSHNPDIIFRIPRGCVDYLLCGHFHGGQIWAPFNLEFKIFRKERLSKMGIKRGLHKIRGINLYINRGLGNVLVPLRFLSRPEITVFYLP